jgi:hypothetical protein
MRNSGVARIIEAEIRKMSNIKEKADYHRDGTNDNYNFEIKACKYKVKQGIHLTKKGKYSQQYRHGTFAIHRTQHDAMLDNTYYIFVVYNKKPDDILFTLIVHKDKIGPLLNPSETTRIGWRRLFKEVGEWKRGENNG